MFRHMTVEDNITFGLKIRNAPLEKRRERCQELLDLVGLVGLNDRYEDELSGGQRQRVALARALAYEPTVLLLDEPFGALDVKIRMQLRRNFREIQRSLAITTLLVTHDQEEAFELGRRIGIVERGRLLEVGAPEELYARPRTFHTATFVGSGTVLVGRCRADRVELGTARLAIPAGVPHQDGDRVRVLLRPEQLELSPVEPLPEVPALGRGVLVEENFAGALRRVRVRLPPVPGVRQIAPPLSYGQEGLQVEAALSNDAPRPPAEPWVRLRGWHVLARPTTRLLVCDPGTSSTHVLATARSLSDPFDASITALGFVSSPAAAAAQREALAARMQELGLQEAEMIVRQGDPAEEIEREQAGARYDFLLVGEGVLGRPRPARRRSTAEYLLDRVTTPLFVVRGQPSPIRSILICTAAGEQGKSGIRVGGWIARRLGARVTLLYVTAVQEETPLWARSHLERGIATLSDLEVQSSIRLRPAVSAVEGVLAEMADGGHDLAVVGNARPGPRTFFGGSDLTRQIIKRLGSSIVVVPEGAW
jgi:ABC-type Fe3+/spermidine/putrescine transport system ATPase subunit/nucleotide-binding universal stress UspA family protein